MKLMTDCIEFKADRYYMVAEILDNTFQYSVYFTRVNEVISDQRVMLEVIGLHTGALEGVEANFNSPTEGWKPRHFTTRDLITRYTSWELTDDEVLENILIHKL